ncbi:MAG: hypothetical protein II942_04110 [Alphaproteobacteria bacterium]|nr:hypothetical protein [Alphaproteobacteria bacterium]
MRNKDLINSNESEMVPFLSAEEAWFWYCLCTQMGPNHSTNRKHKIVRPCELSDIIIAVKKLVKIGQLRPAHIKVLAKYGFEQVPPHPHFGDSSKVCMLWQEALGFLTTILKQKGIVGT